MDWENHVDQIAPFVVKIQTQFGYGTGYIFWQDDTYCCIATAKHVISPANEKGWEQAILISLPNGSVVRFYPSNRRILEGTNSSDSAAILVHKNGLNFPPNCLPLWNFSGEIPIGASVGWLGFPQVVDQSVPNPSFFSGNISNAFQHLQQYAIDGVAIHGVSGGPLFCTAEGGGALVIGTISSYFPNTIVAEGNEKSLPGISIAHSFSTFSRIIDNLNDSGKLKEIITT